MMRKLAGKAHGITPSLSPRQAARLVSILSHFSLLVEMELKS